MKINSILLKYLTIIYLSLNSFIAWAQNPNSEKMLPTRTKMQELVDKQLQAEKEETYMYLGIIVLALIFATGVFLIYWQRKRNGNSK